MQEKPINKLKQELHSFIINWNNKFPIDRWWRTKHNIAFGSIEHKNANFIQMFLEFEEDDMIKKLSSAQEASEFNLDGEEPMSQTEIDDEFDNLNLEEYNERG